MRILVVCGAGASSTFVAQRLRVAAARRGEEVQVSAGTEDTLGAAAEPLDLVLVGPHLESVYPRVREAAAVAGAACALLPPDAFEDREGTRLLEFARSVLDSSPAHHRFPGGNHD